MTVPFMVVIVLLVVVGAPGGILNAATTGLKSLFERSAHSS
jgi:hypothetical protein